MTVAPRRGRGVSISRFLPPGNQKARLRRPRTLCGTRTKTLVED